MASVKTYIGNIKGPKGDKGDPGYTPVKGKDYFDGAPGKDGYTPKKNVDYFDGKDGAPGKDGQPGKDYVLTEADKKEIAELAAQEVKGVEVTAKPGQLIRVKETDENGKPTAWEAVPWGYTEGGMVEILPETTLEGLTGGEAAVTYITVPLSLEDGARYTIVYNGKEYNCTAHLDSETNATMSGNLMAMGAEDTGEPFGIMTLSAEDAAEAGFYGQMIVYDGSTSVTLSIYHNAEIHHPIPGELLPEGVPYVYKDYLLEETDAVETTDPRFGKAWMIVGAPSLVIGKTYTVIYNGVPYDCVGFDGGGLVEGAVALGNTAATGGANTGEPFAMLVAPSYNTVICIDLSGATYVRIGIMGKVGHKIDPMCLPVLIVAVDTASMTADKTYDEIYTAVKAGRTVLLFYGDDIGSFVSASTYDVCFVVSRTEFGYDEVAKVTKTFVIVNESGTVDTWEQ
jgi:hypothetical protein